MGFHVRAARRRGDVEPGAGQASALRQAAYEARRLPGRAGDTPGTVVSDQVDVVKPGIGIAVTEMVKKWVLAGVGQFGSSSPGATNRPAPTATRRARRRFTSCGWKSDSSRLAPMARPGRSLPAYVVGYTEI
jgi:hypothetical protein